MEEIPRFSPQQHTQKVVHGSYKVQKELFLWYCCVCVCLCACVSVYVCMCMFIWGRYTHCEGSRTTLDIFLRCYPRTHPGTLWAGYMGCIESPRDLSNSSSPVLDYKCSIPHTILSLLKRGSSHKLSLHVCRANPSLDYFLNIFCNINKFL